MYWLKNSGCRSMYDIDHLLHHQGSVCLPNQKFLPLQLFCIKVGKTLSGCALSSALDLMMILIFHCCPYLYWSMRTNHASSLFQLLLVIYTITAWTKSFKEAQNSNKCSCAGSNRHSRRKGYMCISSAVLRKLFQYITPSHHLLVYLGIDFHLC